MFDYKYTSI